MKCKIVIYKVFMYSILLFGFVFFYMKETMIDFIKGRTTMTSRLENTLNLEFPTLTICMNPGYKYSIMEKYGFRTVGNVLLKSVPNKTLNEVFEESSFILNRDFEIHFAKSWGKSRNEINLP